MPKLSSLCFSSRPDNLGNLGSDKEMQPELVNKRFSWYAHKLNMRELGCLDASVGKCKFLTAAQIAQVV